MEQSDEAFYTLINGLRANLDQGWAGDTLTEEDVVVLLAGITRLRAALADAQAVGFAAGVEAAGFAGVWCVAQDAFDLPSKIWRKLRGKP